MLYVTVLPGNLPQIPLKRRMKYDLSVEEIEFEEAKKILTEAPRVCIIGGDTVWSFVNDLFGVKIECVEPRVYLDEYDRLIIITLRQRVWCEQTIKNKEELEKLGYTIWYIEVLYADYD